MWIPLNAGLPCLRDDETIASLSHSLRRSFRLVVCWDFVNAESVVQDFTIFICAFLGLCGLAHCLVLTIFVTFKTFGFMRVGFRLFFQLMTIFMFCNVKSMTLITFCTFLITFCLMLLVMFLAPRP